MYTGADTAFYKGAAEKNRRVFDGRVTPKVRPLERPPFEPLWARFILFLRVRIFTTAKCWDSCAPTYDASTPDNSPTWLSSRMPIVYRRCHSFVFYLNPARDLTLITSSVRISLEVRPMKRTHSSKEVVSTLSR